MRPQFKRERDEFMLMALLECRIDIPLLSSDTTVSALGLVTRNKSGTNDYIAKPVSAWALAEVLDKWLPPERNDDEQVKNSTDAGGKQELPIFTWAEMVDRLGGDSRG